MHKSWEDREGPGPGAPWIWSRRFSPKVAKNVASYGAP